MHRQGPRVLYWCDTTERQPFETGIQRVTRRLGQGLGGRGVHVVPVGWEKQGRRMQSLRRGVASPQYDVERPLAPAARWLIVPEIPMSVLADDLDPIQIARAYGLSVAAIVHDLIPVRLPHLYTPEASKLFRRYYRMFARADLVLATTDLVAGHLRAHLEAEGLPVPQIVVVPLPAQFAHRPRVRERPTSRTSSDALWLLTVTTWEPRKNLPALLRALRSARERCAEPIRLTIVGRRGDYAVYDAEVEALLAEIPQGVARDRVGDEELAGLYAGHHASVYPSCEEGFGLPVLESLWLGRPCLCHAGSAMAEVAPGGGTLMSDMSDEGAIADALVRLSEEPGLLERLTDEALARPLRDWDAYAADVAEGLDLATQAYADAARAAPRRTTPS